MTPERILDLWARRTNGGPHPQSRGVARGVSNGAATIADAVVCEIRRLGDGGMSQRAIARETGVSQRQVGRVLRGEAREGVSMAKAIVLLSGGLDSTVTLYEAIAVHGSDQIAAIGISYGQRHAFELVVAERIAENAGVPFRRITVGLPHGSALMDARAIAPDSRAAVVPGRNSHFALVAGHTAAEQGANEVWMGCCADDAEVFADCRPEWVLTMSALLSSVVSPGMRIVTPMIDRSKTQIVTRAHFIGAECWHAVGASWSCYAPPGTWNGTRPPPCGTCGACVARARGFLEAGHIDPASP